MWSLREVDRSCWDEFWPRIRGANLLQCWEYGNAKAGARGWRPLRFSIETTGGEPKGLVQVLTRTLPVLGGVARINRGPLLFGLSEEDDRFLGERREALVALLQTARHRKWWLVRIAPEVPAGESSLRLLRELGLKPVDGPAWGSSRVLLEVTEKELFQNLKGKWRNLLRKAQRFDLHIRLSTAGEDIERMLGLYVELQKRLDFKGIPERMIRKLATQKGPQFDFSILWAASKDHEDPVGMIVTVGHGDTATYLIGWTSREGRQLQANYQLLWHALLMHREGGLRWFDLGGLGAGTPAGIAHFKSGLGGVRYTLAGEWNLRFAGRTADIEQ